MRMAFRDCREIEMRENESLEFRLFVTFPAGPCAENYSHPPGTQGKLFKMPASWLAREMPVRAIYQLSTTL
jgi:hypothetical protein